MILGKIVRNPVIQLGTILFSVFFIQTVFSSQEMRENYFILRTPLETYPWTIITNVYSHASIGHLVSNLVGLVIFGLAISRSTSATKFHIYFLLSGVVAGISQVLTIYYLGEFGLISLEEQPGVLGASGGIFALFGYLVTSNVVSSKISSLLSLSPRMRYIIYVGVAVWVTLATGSPGAALIAHFTGFFIGLVSGNVNLLRGSDIF